MKPWNANKLLRSFSNLIFALLALLMISSCTSKWPQFRGPESNQLTKEKNLPLEWGNDKNISWKIKVNGRGWSCPVVWGDKLFITSAVLEDSTQQRIRREGGDVRKINPSDAIYSWEVYCLNFNTGEELWKRTAYKGIPKIPTHRDNTYASETPVTDGKRVYVYFGMTGLYCYEMDGNLVWEKDLGSYLTQGDWGTSTSPVLFKNNLYMQFDNEEKSFLVALDSESGEEIWRVSRDEKTNWSTPIIWKNRIRTELVTSGQNARSYDPLTGKLLWELNLGGGRNISSPVADNEMIYLGNEKRRDGGGTLFAVKAGAEGDITPGEGETVSPGVAWSQPESGLAMASPLLYEGLIYIVERRRGMIFCYEASTGKPVYQSIKVPDAGPFWASPWAVDGRIYCLDEKGT
ncbi:PQQ-like beta-propeller repeat protein, partial [bacterium]|nr:PQQ-like beta-propeller repeat protein [bacterium]